MTQLLTLHHNKSEVRIYVITSLNDMGPRNIIVGRWELGLNLSIVGQLSKHPIVISRDPTEQELNTE